MFLCVFNSLFLALIIIVNVTVDVVIDVTIAKLLPNENKEKRKIILCVFGP